MKLHYTVLGEGKPLIILHGLFGCSDNWRSHGKKIAEYFQVYMIDLRNHGHSAWNNEFSYQNMVDDVFEFMQEHHLSDATMLGHSMGGKVAMLFAQQHPDLIEKLIVVDMGIKAYPPHHQHILKAINTLDLSSIKKRSEAHEHMGKYIDSEGVKQFLLKNIYWKEQGKLAWRMNVKILEAKMPEILKAIESIECLTQTLFIRGELSQYILDEDISSLETAFPDSQFVTVKNAGHWVHAESPEVFLNAVLEFTLR